jgi:hypothetical protein
MQILQREYETLRKQRVGLRATRERLVRATALEPQKLYGPDGHLNRLAQLDLTLRATQSRWEELSRLLGKPLSRPPVKLGVAHR